MTRTGQQGDPGRAAVIVVFNDDPLCGRVDDFVQPASGIVPEDQGVAGAVLQPPHPGLIRFL
ncbi:MAG: hypothetical protein AB1752_07845, partial [Candidatus Zixiibacteriota bacterium]